MVIFFSFFEGYKERLCSMWFLKDNRVTGGLADSSTRFKKSQNPEVFGTDIERFQEEFSRFRVSSP